MARRKSRTVHSKKRAQPNDDLNNGHDNSLTKDSIKATEELALAAFASGLRLAAAFGTVAAKTTSLALSSLAIGVDKFSQLVKEESLKSNSSRKRRALHVSATTAGRNGGVAIRRRKREISDPVPK